MNTIQLLLSGGSTQVLGFRGFELRFQLLAHWPDNKETGAGSSCQHFGVDLESQGWVEDVRVEYVNAE